MDRKKNHHNGAVTPRSDSPNKKKKKKNMNTGEKSRQKAFTLKSLAKQLEEERIQTTALLEELAKERAEKAELQANVSALQTAIITAENGCLSMNGATPNFSVRQADHTSSSQESQTANNAAENESSDFDGGPKHSSTRRADPAVILKEFQEANNVVEDRSEDFVGTTEHANTERVDPSVTLQESRFISSVNQLSVSSLTIPECKPLVDEEEITRHCYELWKDLLCDSMKLAGIQDEETKFVLFRIKAGSRLLGIYNNTKSTDGAPDQKTHPFSNALHRMKLYFASGSDIMLQRRKLAFMTQKSEESDLTFVNRVASTARLCDYTENKELEEIIECVAGHAANREVRKAALRILNRRGTVIDLMNAVKEIETIQINEDYFNLKHGIQKPALVAPIRADYPKNPVIRNRFHPYNGRGTASASRNQHRNAAGSTRSNLSHEGKCWRCNNPYHLPNDCRAFVNQEVCRNCGRIGHYKRACRFPDQSAPPNSRKQETKGMITEKIATVVADKKEHVAEPSEIVSGALEI
ncbi:uncharacterized protein LOC129723923 [Wyeomyia smithii]|uniref:uncharacterized protein LOC129723923 n=1 Tax=Wyeomyia smithii TaxID=174621 RepID=UPI002467AEF3|nr:uncharacterized protein LOC129723923 [Wyeomyia smithii]